MYRGEAKLIFTCTRGAKYDPLVLQYALFTARPSWDHLTNDRNFGLNRAIPMKSWAMQVVQLCCNAQRRRSLSYAQTGRMAPGTATLAVTTTSYDTDILPSPPNTIIANLVILSTHIILFRTMLNELRLGL